MVQPPSFSALSRRREQTSREWEIDRFRQWAIKQFTYDLPPPGFHYGSRVKPRVDMEAVNEAIHRFITSGFRYPHYPHSNF